MGDIFSYARQRAKQQREGYKKCSGAPRGNALIHRLCAHSRNLTGLCDGGTYFILKIFIMVLGINKFSVESDSDIAKVREIGPGKNIRPVLFDCKSAEVSGSIILPNTQRLAVISAVIHVPPSIRDTATAP